MRLRTLVPAAALAPLIVLTLACSGSADGTMSGPTATTGGVTPTTPTTTTSTDPVTAAKHNATQVATVGTALNYDASMGNTCFTDPRGGGLTYSFKFSPSANGLTSSGGRVTGAPTTPGLVTVTITAMDAGGALASDSFEVIAFAAGLTTPVVDASFKYTDADGNVPGHFTGTGGVVGGQAGGPGGLVSATDNTPSSNPITNAGAALGRVLFYDTRLSGNDAQACANCHVQSTGFADTSRLSRGFQGGATGRHSMSLANARYYSRGRFFWDERAVTLEDQVLRPIQDTVEMGMTLDLLEKKLAATSYYPALFNAAFGTTAVTRDRISKALAQFVRSLVSGRSKFDQGILAPGGTATVFTPAEEQGRGLFASAGCARCHTTFAQLADDIHNTGLDATITDVGAGNGQFKVPSLRNVAVRGRFMHDGRFTTLDQVVTFYDSGVQPNPGLDPRLGGRGGQPTRLNLTANERAALVAFLGTLTDQTFLTDVRFASPFAK